MQTKHLDERFHLVQQLHETKLELALAALRQDTKRNASRANGS